jgi:hypothetical protein
MLGLCTDNKLPYIMSEFIEGFTVKSYIQNKGELMSWPTTEISTHPNSTQQESNYIYLYTMKFGTSIKIRPSRKFESTEFETMRVNAWYYDTG